MDDSHFSFFDHLASKPLRDLEMPTIWSWREAEPTFRRAHFLCGPDLGWASLIHLLQTPSSELGTPSTGVMEDHRAVAAAVAVVCSAGQGVVSVFSSDSGGIFRNLPLKSDSGVIWGLIPTTAWFCLFLLLLQVQFSSLSWLICELVTQYPFNDFFSAT